MQLLSQPRANTSRLLLEPRPGDTRQRWKPRAQSQLSQEFSLGFQPVGRARSHKGTLPRFKVQASNQNWKTQAVPQQKALQGAQTSTLSPLYGKFQLKVRRQVKTLGQPELLHDLRNQSQEGPRSLLISRRDSGPRWLG